MTEYEIKSIYEQIEGLNSSEIQNRVDLEFTSSDAGSFNVGALMGAAVCGAVGGGFLGGFFKGDYDDKAMQAKKKLEYACRKLLEQNRHQVLTIIQNNPKTSKGIMDIVLLLAPAIAQQYGGFSGMAIVGTLTIACKQCLGL